VARLLSNALAQISCTEPWLLLVCIFPVGWHQYLSIWHCRAGEFSHCGVSC